MKRVISNRRLTAFSRLVRSRPAALAVGAVALIALIGACSSSPSSANHSGTSSQHAASDTYIIMPGITTDPGYVTMVCGAKYEASKLGVKLVEQGTTTWDATLQIPLLQSLLAQHPAALILTPNDAVALEPVVRQYRARNIPVVTLDTTINDQSLLYSAITSSGTQGGAAAANALAKQIGGSGEVFIMGGLPTVSTSVDRTKGFESEMHSKYPGIKIVSVQYSNDSISAADTKTRAMLLAYPDLKGIFAIDGNDATGAAAAVAADGKKGKIAISGYDAEPPTVKLLQNGSVSQLVMQDFATEGKLGVEAAYEAVNHKPRTVAKSVELNNIIATSHNMNSPSITKYFYRSTCRSSY